MLIEIVLYICLIVRQTKLGTMEILLKELEDLKSALKCKSISVNEYSTFYYQISQKIKRLNINY